MKRYVSYAAGSLLLAAAGQASALEIDPHVPPQVDIGGRALVTGNWTDNGARDTELDLSDSSLLFGFSKYLFDDRNYGFANFGFKVPEDEAAVRSDLYLHQMHVGVGGPRYEVLLGRTQMPNTLVRFPTLRDDDLLEFTHVGNVFNHAGHAAEEYDLYGGLIQGTWFFPTQRLYASAAAVARTETDAEGDGRETSANFNSWNLELGYNVPEAIRFERGLRYLAVGWDRQEHDAGNQDAYLLGATFNLNNNPEASWNLDLQGIHTRGVDGVATLAEEVDRAQARSNAVVASLRYGHRPWLQTRWQAALTAAWKDYTEFDDATTWAVAPSFAYLLGRGVDLVAQYRYTDRDDGLGGGSEHRVYAGLVFSLDYTLNKHVGQRDSILMLEHDMVRDVGPRRGGH
ncbi:porin [Ectothiorhodospiraceae bacterium 2226]|nr:porin [Ectothiorhodospiraceae bacterium 2226]